jgi:hypothetical protein
MYVFTFTKGCKEAKPNQWQHIYMCLVGGVAENQRCEFSRIDYCKKQGKNALHQEN